MTFDVLGESSFGFLNPFCLVLELSLLLGFHLSMEQNQCKFFKFSAAIFFYIQAHFSYSFVHYCCLQN
jgi:hypothetical protein